MVVLLSKRKFKLTTVQGHPTLSILMPIESTYATSYLSLMVNLGVSPTAFEILTHKGSKYLVFSPIPCLTPLLRRNPSKFLDETYSAKTRGMKMPYGENFIILT